MEIKWNYGQGVLVLPASVLSVNATQEQMGVLLWLANDPTLADKPAQLAKLADCSREDIKEILAFWQDCGVLAGGNGKTAGSAAKTAASAQKKEPPEKKVPEKPLRHADELPVYTSTELADMMEQRSSLRMLVDESQHIFGKMFTSLELNILFGLVDYLNLDEEYILLLLTHCKMIGLKSLHSVEKYAISLIDKGITSADALEARVKELEKASSLEGKIRSMFGMGSRALTQKEKKMLENWVSFGYDEEIIRRAYEITVNTAGKSSIPYSNSILERWHSEGLKTVQEIDRKLEADREEKAGKTTLGNSFDTDDFFEAALQRSFRKNDTEQN